MNAPFNFFLRIIGLVFLLIHISPIAAQMMEEVAQAAEEIFISEVSTAPTRRVESYSPIAADSIENSLSKTLNSSLISARRLDNKTDFSLLTQPSITITGTIFPSLAAKKEALAQAEKDLRMAVAYAIKTSDVYDYLEEILRCSGDFNNRRNLLEAYHNVNTAPKTAAFLAKKIEEHLVELQNISEEEERLSASSYDETMLFVWFDGAMTSIQEMTETMRSVVEETISNHNRDYKEYPIREETLAPLKAIDMAPFHTALTSKRWVAVSKLTFLTFDARKAALTQALQHAQAAEMYIFDGINAIGPSTDHLYAYGAKRDHYFETFINLFNEIESAGSMATTLIKKLKKALEPNQVNTLVQEKNDHPKVDSHEAMLFVELELAITSIKISMQKIKSFAHSNMKNITDSNGKCYIYDRDCWSNVIIKVLRKLDQATFDLN